MLLAASCKSSPCWAPTPPPAWTWLVYVAIAVAAGLIIFIDWRTSPPAERGRVRAAVIVWLLFVVIAGVSAGALEVYTYSIAPK